MYPLCIIVGNSGQGIVLLQEDRDPGDYVALLREKTTKFGDYPRPPITVVTQRTLQIVDIFPRPARPPDLSPIEPIWDIIGRKLQYYPQPALTVPVCTQQI
ncbi:hypothetical protein TNCV_2237191 [Trichonephila clavipes]|nr:hypothetical protein TNCV_2237191 [Trichonephila clavipes]